MSTAEALLRVLAGRVDPPAPTHESADALWCRLVAEGRIVQRADDGSSPREYRVTVVLVEHPGVVPGEVYALFGMGAGSLTAYRCAPADALAALTDPSAFNL